MRIEISGEADEAMGKMDGSMRKRFDKHIMKIANVRPTRFLADQNIEDVGHNDGRIIYKIDLESDILFILKCFPDHKSYDKWRDSLRKG